ncbi:MAG: HigA family addiction module antitoxin [Candidatus Acidiferrales bacterium]
MLDIREAAEAFPPGEILKDELEARGWTQDTLAEITGIPGSVISNIVNGKRAISVEIASSLASALGTSAQLWMNLETSYQLWMETRADDKIARKALLYSLAPINELIKRGWIEATKNLDDLEQRLLAFLERQSVDEPSQLVFAAKRSTEKANPSQVAWVYRAKKLARGIRVGKFSDESFARALKILREFLKNAEDLREIPKVLAEAGIRLVLIEGLPKGRIDGATFWLEDGPVIVMSMRYDRLDYFWFILMHELGHIANRDAVGAAPILDVNLVGDDAIPFEDKSEVEKRADMFAENFLIERREIDNFIARVAPLYSKVKIKKFAARIGVHPAIVLGRLQFRKEVDWSHSREMLVKARDILILGVLTDGWGHTPPTL